jgi:arylsulfatase A-like enzyme
MRNFHLTNLASFAVFVLSTGQSTAQPKILPNVIVIITDDQGWGDIGYNNPKVYSPNMDNLASQGAKFMNHYSMPQCTPTRISIFTGKYPGRYGKEGLMATNEQVFPLGIQTMATMFKENGYDTFQCGKWHMGCSSEFGPNNYGFDESYGSLGGAVGMYDHRYRDGKYEITWHRNLKIIPGYENGVHATDLVANEADQYIRKKHDKPFFMYLAFHAVHTPLDERGEFVNRPTQLDPKNPNRWLDEDKIKWFNDPEGKIQQESDPEKRLLLAAVYHLDYAIGQVVNALDETAQRKNTLILFTSDNGPQVDWQGKAYPNDLKLTDFNQPIPMRGSKCDVWEGGIHVPGFANWPTHIQPKQIKEPTHVVDFLPTLAKLLDHTPNQAGQLDGIDISSALLMNSSLPQRDLYWIWNSSIDRWALRFGNWKIVKYGIQEPKENEWQLYNLKQDPKEKTNVASKYPKMVSKLHALFLKQRGKDRSTGLD